MKIAICGAGLVGSYLFRLLRQADFEDITVFENPVTHRTSCGISPCAWGTSAGFEELIEVAGLDPAKYILQTFNSMVVNDLKVKATAMVIDKPKLNADLLNGAEVLKSPVQAGEFDRIIDTTGFDRAFLPPLDKELICSCVQYRVFSQAVHELCIDISNLGYAWRFPMSDHEYHIGAGSIVIPPQKMLERLGWLKNSSSICACAGKIRLTGPHFSLPFVGMSNDNRCAVWGAGEAIGCVDPLIGEGIIPGMKSARLLLANWEDPEAYQRAIIQEFSWMQGERKILDKAVQGKRMNLFDARILRNSTRRFKMNLDLNQSLSLLKSINRT